ncbi:MAG: hypothetical protein QF652_03855, partial [Dehalococcoidia bacterium]|nr:hypothetical protein [Dehalococcoidia bacterium]
MSQRPQGTDAIRLRGRSGRPRIFHGWWVVAVSLLLGIFQGGVLFYGFTLIITPLRDETGWSATQV